MTCKDLSSDETLLSILGSFNDYLMTAGSTIWRLPWQRKLRSER